MTDDFCKQLVARHPASISRWLLALTEPVQPAPADGPGPIPNWQLLDRELSSDPLHADSVILLPTNPGQTAEPILHLEFQTRPDPLMAERMLDDWIRLHRRFHRPIRQVVLHLKPTRSPLARIAHLAIGRTRHHFSSLRRSAAPHHQRLPVAGRPNLSSRRDSASPRHEHPRRLR